MRAIAILLFSTAVTLTLAASPAHAETVRIAGTASATGTMKRLVDVFHKRGTKTKVVVLPAVGSTGGIRAVLAGAAEIAATGRMPQSEDLERGLVAFEYGRTPFVFVTQARNPADNIARRDVEDFYSGKRTTWPDGTPVRLVLRPATDTDTRLLMTLSPGIEAAVNIAARHPGMTIADSDHDAADAIERLPGSLGVSSLALIVSEHRSMKVLKLDGVEPNVKAVAEQRYPLFKQLYLVTRREPTPGVGEFIHFVRSKAGQAVLEQTAHLVPAR